jgi:hypothetical protein
MHRTPAAGFHPIPVGAGSVQVVESGRLIVGLYLVQCVLAELFGILEVVTHFGGGTLGIVTLDNLDELTVGTQFRLQLGYGAVERHLVSTEQVG